MTPLDHPRPRRRYDALSALASAGHALRPGASLPSSSAPYFGVPPAEEPGACSDARESAEREAGAPTRLRRSLAASTAEGVAAEVVGACASGAALMAWALFLGCAPVLLGLLAALPFLGQAVQLPAAWLTSRFGRRRVAILAVAVSRQAYLPLALLPFVPLSPAAKQGALFAVASLAAVAGVVGNNAWVAWMGELVPAAIRGRYFGKRTALCTLGGTLAALGVGAVLDRAHTGGWTGWALAALTGVASLVGALTTVLMVRQHDPEAVSDPVAFNARAALRPLRDPAARRLLTYQLCWSGAVGLGGGFFSVHMLQNLHTGFVGMALHGTAAAAVRLLSAPLWGRAVDRVGARPVLVTCSFGIALMPLLWSIARPDWLWPIALDAALSGIVWGGHGIAMFSLPLAVSPRVGRPFYLAAFAMAGGLGFALASSAAGVVAQALPASLVMCGLPVLGLHVLFAASSCGRALAALLSLRIIEPRAHSVTEMLDVVAPRLRVLLARKPR